MDGPARILDVTEVAVPPLVPEVKLHLVTPRCALWSAGEAELEALGLGEPFWAFAWPGGQALARYLLDNPGFVRGRRVLDFGAGGGVEAVAAALAGARTVRATDIDPLAAVACGMNASLNGVRIDADSEDVLGHLDLDVDVVLAGDVTYEAELGTRVVDWLARLSAQGVDVLVADPGRGFLPEQRLEAVACYEAPSDVDVDGRYRVTTWVRRIRA